MNRKTRRLTPWLPLSLLLLGGSAMAGGDTCDIKIHNDNDRGEKIFVYKGSDTVDWIAYDDKEVNAGSSWSTDCGTDQNHCTLRWRPTILGAGESSNIQNYGKVSVDCDETYSVTEDHS